MDVNKMKLVIVEDGETDFGALVQSLEDQGYAVKTVGSGKEAEAELKDFDGLVVKRVSQKKRGKGSRVIRAGEIEIDPVRCEARKGGRGLALTLREFNLLTFLIKGKGRVYSREDLLSEVWGYAYPGDIRTVDVTIRRLREKLEDQPSRPRYIKTRRSVGYYFEAGY